MSLSNLFGRANKAARFLRTHLPDPPPIAIVLGSGMGALSDRLSDPVTVPYAEIPHFPLPTVVGHPGNIIVGGLGAARVMFLQGRFHDYEGHDLETVTFPIRVLQALGARSLILTAATGGIDPALRPGDLVCLSDHLNLLGRNPLRGLNDDRLGSRFPDMSEVYSARLRAIALEAAANLDLPLATGVYACMPGPSYETPAEIRMLRTLGADVVGMSTVPEAIVARHAGMEILAFALVTNAAAGVSDLPISHEEVLEEGHKAIPRLGALLEAVARAVGRSAQTGRGRQ